MRHFLRSFVVGNQREPRREVFQHLNKIREVGEPFDKVIVSHDLIKTQKELKQLVQHAKEKEW